MEKTFKKINKEISRLKEQREKIKARRKAAEHAFKNLRTQQNMVTKRIQQFQIKIFFLKKKEEAEKCKKQA